MGMGTSTFLIRWINFFTMLLAVAVIGFSLWMNTHDDACRKSLTLPVLALGALILLVSFIGFLGALKGVAILLWLYLGMLCVILLAILIFTVLAFIITNGPSGHEARGLQYKEYRLEDYSPWFQKQLKDLDNWRKLKSCLVKLDSCKRLPKKYQTLKEYKMAELTPIEAGCCGPPSVCGYPPVNASFYDLSFHPATYKEDCKLYNNSHTVRCYNCDSCKAGVAQLMKMEWRVVAIFNMVLFIILLIVYVIGCCARRSASTRRSDKI